MELEWRIKFEDENRFKRGIDTGSLPEVINALERGRDSGEAEGSKWRIEVLADGEEVSVSSLDYLTRSALCDSVARKVINQTKEHKAEIEKFKEEIRGKMR